MSSRRTDPTYLLALARERLRAGLEGGFTAAGEVWMVIAPMHVTPAAKIILRLPDDLDVRNHPYSYRTGQRPDAPAETPPPTTFISPPPPSAGVRSEEVRVDAELPAWTDPLLEMISDVLHKPCPIDPTPATKQMSEYARAAKILAKIIDMYGGVDNTTTANNIIWDIPAKYTGKPLENDDEKPKNTQNEENT